MARNRSNISSTSTGMMPSDGSSSMISLGSAIIARAIASICCSPPDIVTAILVQPLGEARENRGRCRAISSTSRFFSGDATQAEPQIFAHGEPLHDAPLLRHVGEAERVAHMRRPAQQLLALEHHRPARPVHQAHDRCAASWSCRRRCGRSGRRSRPSRTSMLDALQHMAGAVPGVQVADAATSHQCSRWPR